MLTPDEISLRRSEAVSTAKNGDLSAGLLEMERLYALVKDNPSLTGDYLVLLTWQEDWNKVVRVYEQNKGLALPAYVFPEVARAYRFTGQPDKAGELYEQYLLSYPEDINATIGLARVLIDKRAYSLAQEYIDKLIAHDPKKVDYYLIKSDLFVLQDRLSEAQDVLSQALMQSPDDQQVLANLAQIYLWRGWPRKAFELFSELRQRSQTDVLINNGYANALNATAHKKLARELIDRLQSEQPAVLNYRRTKRSFAVEDMTSWSTRALYGNEMPGEDEFLFVTRLDHPLTLHHTLFASYLRRMITQNPKNDVLSKEYLGDQWQPNDHWRLIGALSSQYANNRDKNGGLGQVTYAHDDHWSATAFYESQIADVPLRSRKEGTNVDEYQLSLTGRMSELFNSTVGADFRDFSDKNNNVSYFWYTDTSLIRREKWSSRLATELYYSAFSKQDVSYFAPESRTSVYITPMLEHVWFRKAARAFVERYYAGVGQVWQKYYSAQFIGFLRYEQEHKISDMLSLLAGTTYWWNSYDGASAKRLDLYSSLRASF